jgi:hypothetical protein
VFSASPEDLDPIREVALLLEPGTDFRKLGSWGILFLCCGALAGQSPSWRWNAFESIRVPTFLDWLDYQSGAEADPEHYGIKFAEVLTRWAHEPMARALVDRGLTNAGPSPEPRMREKMLDYLTLALMLNSMGDYDEEGFVEIQRWAEARADGWEQLFFGAGLVVSSDREFPWDRMGTVFLATVGGHKPAVKRLFERFTSRR